MYIEEWQILAFIAEIHIQFGQGKLSQKLTSNLQATLLPNMGNCSLSICVQAASLPTNAITGTYNNVMY